MWILHTPHKTLVQISENMYSSHCRESSLHSLLYQNPLAGKTAWDVIFVLILVYYVKSTDYFFFFLLKINV